MKFAIAFLEGMITFISPCLLPLLPVYLSYFGGGGAEGGKKTMKNALGFVLGFTLVFVLMGGLAGRLGGFLKLYRREVNLISGLIVILFGLNYLGVLKLKLFRGGVRAPGAAKIGFFSSVLFGMIFSIGWTPCVGAFLGAALLLASQSGHAAEGMLMLFAFSAGLGVPFLLSAVLIDRLKSGYGWIKRNYGVINTVCGIFLVLVGILMAGGLMGRLLAFFS